MLYSDMIDNGDTSLVDMLSSVTGIKFSDEENNVVPISSAAHILQNYITESNEPEERRLGYDSSVMMNSDPMLNSTDSTDYAMDITAWKTKPVNEWTTEDVLFWVSAESEKAGLDILLDSNMPNLCTLTGADLIEMTLEDFLRRMTNNSFAKKLYNSLQNNILNPNNRNNINSDVLTTLRTCSLEDNTSSDNNQMYYSYSSGDEFSNITGTSSNSLTVKFDNDSGVESCSDSEQCYDSIQNSLNDETWSNYTQIINNNSTGNFNEWQQPWSASQSNHFNENSHSECVSPDLDSRIHCSDDELSTTSADKPKEEPQQPVKKRPGRPRGIRKKKPEKVGRLWEFLRDLLHNPNYNPSIICWDNYDIGAFRFVHSEKVAQLWGSKKENSSMTFEKFSRAMRYYYKGKVLIAVQKRLVYRFGKNATGWRTPNPILR